VQQSHNPESRLKAVAAALGASAALLLGARYGLGAAVEARRLSIARVSIADLLPQVPLPQMLAEGIDLLIGSLFVVAITTLVVIALLHLETRLEPFLESQRRRSRTVKSRMATTWGHIRSLQAESKALAKTAEDTRNVIANPPEVEPPTTPEQHEALLEKKAELDQLLVDARSYKTRLRDLDTRVKEADRQHRRFGRQVRLANVPFKVFAKALRWGPLCVALVAGLFVTPVLAASFVTAGLVWRLSRHTDLRVLLVTLYAIIVLGYVTDRIIYVSPLPKAEVTTESGIYRGTLALTTGSTWYLAAAHEVVRAIPASRIRTARYNSIRGSGGETVANLIEEAL